VKNKTTGTVTVIFIVSGTGKVKDARVKESVSPLLDAEAVRVVSSMPDWKPGMQGGKTVDVYVQVAVNFTLN
jgi:protein TonB